MKVRRANAFPWPLDEKGVIGLDLSLTAAAACWLPWNWDGDTIKPRMMVCGYPLTGESTREDHVARMVHIADEVLYFCLKNKPRAVYVENYAFSQASTSATTLRELGGIVKARFYLSDLKMVPIPVTASAARKTLLQRLPKKDLKRFTEDNVRRLKGEALYWTVDEIDALVVCNHGIMLEGGTPLSYPGVSL